MHETHWPLVYVQHIGPLTDAYFAATLQTFSRHVERGERFAWINDSTTLHFPNAKQREMFVNWYRQSMSTPGALDHVAATVHVTNNKLVQGALTALGWALPFLEYQHKAIFADVLTAERFVRSKIDPDAPIVEKCSYSPEVRSR